MSEENKPIYNKSKARLKNVLCEEDIFKLDHQSPRKSIGGRMGASACGGKPM
jgi:hypothetical protein